MKMFFEELYGYFKELFHFKNLELLINNKERGHQQASKPIRL